MENEIFNQFCVMLDDVMINETAICICMKYAKHSMLATFVPSECSYGEGVYIVSVDDDIVNIESIDDITYDAMEDEYVIQSGDLSIYISRI